MPTPSVEDTSTGRSQRPGSRAKGAPKPPTSASTDSVKVERTAGPMRRTASSPAAMSTPAAA